ncbi:hypothetical protein MBLNU13_g05068t1 [Cladosporium sp. NU13]
MQEDYNLSTVEFKQLFEWAGPTPTRVDACIHDLFAQQVLLRPDAQAIEAWDGSWSYAVLDALSSGLAKHLVTLGIQPGDTVPFCFNKSKWVPIAILGVLRAGGACTALDPDSPRDRLFQIVLKSKAKLILNGADTRDSIIGLTDHQFTVDDSLYQLPKDEKPLPATNSAIIATVQFTSGSTGDPKAIRLQHAALCSSFAAFGVAWDIGPDSRVFQFAAHTFDVAIADILATLCLGGCVCIPSSSERLNDLALSMQRMQVNWTLLTPTIARLLVPKDVPTLRTLVLGGEPVLRENLQTWAGHCQVYLAYGLAEASIYCSSTERTSPESDETNIGRPLGCRFWVCDHRLLPVPPGSEGELVLEGPIVAQDYLGDAANTDTAFVAVPNWLQPHSSEHRLMRTGDFVRWNVNGTLQYLGRRDNQVKVNGVRLELGDIAYYAKLGFANHVQDSVVDVITTRRIAASTSLVVVFVPQEQHNDEGAWQASSVLAMTGKHSLSVIKALNYMRTKLPYNMVPCIFIPITSLPISASGKCDRKLLRQILQQVDGPYLSTCTFDARSDDSEQANGHLHDQKKTSCSEFWQSYLKDAMAVPFPQRPSKPSPCNRLQVSQISESLSKSSTDHHVEPLLTAAWALLIGRHSESNDIIFGVMSGKTDVLPLRTRIPSSTTIATYIKNVEHQLTSIRCRPRLSHAVSDGLGEDFARAKYFQNALVGPCEGDSIELPLVVQWTRQSGDGTLTLAADFDSSWISAQFAKLLLSQLDHVVHQLVVSPSEGLVAHVDFFSTQDDRFVSKLNSTEYLPIAACVHTRVEEQAALHPTKLAVHSTDVDLTYAQLRRSVDYLARDLVASGAVTESFIAFCMNKSAIGIVVELAILKSGAGFVAIDPGCSALRLQEILTHANVAIAVTDQKHAGLFKSLCAHVIVVTDSYWTKSLLASQDTSDRGPLPHVQPGNSCALVYTSGSSGKPKAVVFEHQGLCTSADALGKSLGMDSNTRTFQFSSWTFGASIGEIFATLFKGGTLCIPTEEERLQDVAGSMASLNVNWAWLTPSVASLISPHSVPTLKTLCLGGESASESIVSEWAEHVKLITTYGQTEGTIRCAAHVGLSASTPATSIGTGYVANLWIVEPGRPHLLCPVGAVGELAIEGPTIARGYYHDMVETNRVFNKSPPWLSSRRGHASGRIFLTGDMARYRPDGNVTFVGRRDNQRQAFGIRIEMGEIEAQLLRHLPFTAVMCDLICWPEIRQQDIVACLAMGQPTGADRCEMLPLTASVKTIIRQARANLESLPAYMLPSLYIPITTVPRNVHGKRDRKALSAQIRAMSSTQRTGYTLAHADKIDPSTEKERCLANIWAKTLGVEVSTIGTEDSFFEIGGNSLQAMRLVAAARKCDFYLPVREIFEHRTLSTMSEKLVRISLTHGTNSSKGPTRPLASLDEDCRSTLLTLCEIAEDSVEDFYHCTPMQAALFTGSTRSAEAYSRQFRYELPATLDLERFRSAWETVAVMTPLLRTRIVMIRTGPVQVVVREDVIWSTYFDDAEERLKEDKVTTTRMGSALVRLACLQDRKFVITMHHSIFDGYSLGLLWQSVTQVYLGKSLGLRTPFKAFVDYCEQLDKRLTRDFWTRRILQPSTSSFPLVPKGHIALPDTIAELSVKTLLSSSLSSLVTFSSVIQAAWALVLKIYGHTDFPTFGVALSGRNADLAGIESVCGPTVTTIPLQVPLQQSTTVGVYVQAVQHQLVQVIPHEQFGLHNISNCSKEASLAVNFQTLLVIQNSPVGNQDLSSLGITAIPQSNPAMTTYPLTLECRLNANGFDMYAYFDSVVISTSQMDRILHQMEHVTSLLCKSSRQCKLSELPLLSRHDEAELTAWNTEDISVVEVPVFERIATIAQQRPRDVAVDAFDGTLTYSELDLYSNSLANEIRCRGVREGDAIPFVFSKTKWTSVAVLAILKAGCICTPIEPMHPKNAKAAIVASVMASLVLVSDLEKQDFLTGATCLVVDQHTISTFGSGSCVPQLARSLSKYPAYMIFTSGSTGAPKGVIWNHTTLSTVIHHLATYYGFGEQTRALQFASHVFDISAFEMLGTLAFGGTVCIPSEEDRLGRLSEYIERSRSSWAALTPTASRSISANSVPSLRMLVMVGEPIGLDNINKWLGNVKLFNGYGPCEACVISTSTEITASSRFPESIGVPVGCRVWLVSQSNVNELVPIGAIGEIVIEGPNVGTGYFDEPENTASSFLEPPYWAYDRKAPAIAGGQKFFKTGDLAMYNDDGSICLIGRIDDQAKVRGQRLQLSAVEQALATSQSLDSAMALVPSSGTCKNHLVAILTLSMLTPSTTGIFTPLPKVHRDHSSEVVLDLWALVFDTLPTYMVPTTWLVVSKLPTTPSGKLDRPRIRRWVAEIGDDTLQRTRVTPRDTHHDVADQTDAEFALRTAWSSVLGVSMDNITSRSSFVKLGGDSISAMLVASKCRQQDFAVSVSDILSTGNLAQLAQKLAPRVGKKQGLAQSVKQHSKMSSRRSSPPSAPAIDIHQQNTLSPIQKLLTENGGPASNNHFNQSWVLELTECVPTPLLRSCIAVLVNHHPVLRTRFALDSQGSWTQETLPSGSTLVKFRHQRAESLDAAQAIIKATDSGLDISNGPVFAVCLISISEGPFEHDLLHLVAHHLVVDLVS